ncbi:MAG: peptidylprolyl isomerase [Brevundimonas sp.]
MRLNRYTAGVASAALVTALLTAPVVAQTPQPQQAPAAGALNPAAPAAQAPAAPAPNFQMAEGVVATVNDQIITGFDLRQRMLLLIAMTQVQPTEENLPALQNQALQNLIDEKLQQAELARFEVEVTDEEVQQEIAAMAQDAGTTPEVYLDFLQSGGILPETLRQQVRVQTGWQMLVGGRFSARSRPTRNQVEQAMRQLTEQASRPQYLVGEIFIEAARVGGQQAALDGARQLVAQMIQGAPFQAVARQFSSAPSAARGGDAGWIVQGSVQPPVQQALDALQPGQLSNPIPVEGGVYIIYLRDKRDGASTSLVSLRQMMIAADDTATEAQVADASQRLNALRPQLTCDNILQRATSEQGLLGADLGESDIGDLAPQFQQIAREAEVGSVSGPVRTPLGLHLVAVCGRRAGGPDAPSYQQVQSRLQNEQLVSLARRYIRDLRADALIEFK